jgi:hypothetical protein
VSAIHCRCSRRPHHKIAIQYHCSRITPSADRKYLHSTMGCNLADCIMKHNGRPASPGKDPSRPTSLSLRCDRSRCKHVVLRTSAKLSDKSLADHPAVDVSREKGWWVVSPQHNAPLTQPLRTCVIRLAASVGGSLKRSNRRGKGLTISIMVDRRID